MGIASVAGYVTHGGDFQSIVWFPGRALFNGRDPYNTASFQRYYQANGLFPSYGPIHLWLAVVFAPLPFKVATSIWFVVNLVGMAGLAWLMARTIDRRLGLPAVAAITGIIVLSRPGRGTLFAGQVSVLYTLLCYIAWSQAKKRPWLAAVAVGLALGKPPYGLPLCALLALCSTWKVLWRGVAIFAAGSLPFVVWLSVNDGSPLAFLHNVVNNVRYADSSAPDRPGAPRRIDAISMIARYVHVHLGGMAEVGCFVLVVVGAGWILRRAVPQQGWQLSADVLMLLATTTLLAISHEDYDLVLMAWPFAAALGQLVRAVRTWHTGLAPAHGVSDGHVLRNLEGWQLAMPVLALPALVVSLIPAGDTLRLLHLGTDVGLVTTLTTACLLLAAIGAMIGVASQPASQPRIDLARAPA